MTSDAHQSMEEYQRNFWQRQMTRVEEQVSLPGEGSSSSSINPSDNDAVMAAAVSAAATGKDLMELFKPQAGQLPLARIKKVMKASDDDVKMISAEAPILFARACEIFIADLTCRSYMHATSHRRRTVQRSDVVAAVAGSNVFDFLVDIIPRGDESNAQQQQDAGAAEDDEDDTAPQEEQEAA